MFGGGSGHVFAMIATLKANAALIKKKSWFKAKHDYNSIHNPKRLTYSHCTEAELAEVRKEAIRRNKKDQIKSGIAALIALIITIAAGYYISVLIARLMQ
jgi:hypothetical protein